MYSTQNQYIDYIFILFHIIMNIIQYIKYLVYDQIYGFKLNIVAND